MLTTKKDVNARILAFYATFRNAIMQPISGRSFHQVCVCTLCAEWIGEFLQDYYLT
jgi:hypothetical protein